MKVPGTKGATLSLTTMLAIAFFSLSVVVLLISAGLQAVVNIQTQRAIISREQHLIAQDAAQTVRTFIDDKFEVIGTTVGLIDLVAAAPAEQKRYLESVIGLDPAFRQLILLNADGQEIATVSRMAAGVAQQLSPRGRNDIRMQILQGNRYISSITIDPTTSEPLIFIALPARTALGDLQGILVAEVNLKFMWELVEQLKVGKTGYAYVVNRQGDLIAFSDTSRVLKGENINQLQAVHSFTNRLSADDVTNVDSYQGINGTTVVGTYIPLVAPDWAVVIESPWTEAYEEVIRQTIFSVAVTIGMALIAGLIGIVVARRLSGPLINLTGTATRITAGEVDLQAPIGGAREVASLASAFNSMTSQLRQSMQALERRVIDRTNDLQVALAEVEARAQLQEKLLAENQQQRDTIREMSVPVLPVSDSTLVMPLVGSMDGDRLALLQSQALHAIAQNSVRTLILDITGVLVVDSQVAQGLLSVVQAARLLGTEVLLVGIRPEVAQAIVGLGLNMAGLRTYSDLRSALGRVLE